jgi:S1-C subfamily serine protease
MLPNSRNDRQEGDISAMLGWQGVPARVFSLLAGIRSMMKWVRGLGRSTEGADQMSTSYGQQPPASPEQPGTEWAWPGTGGPPGPAGPPGYGGGGQGPRYPVRRHRSPVALAVILLLGLLAYWGSHTAGHLAAGPRPGSSAIAAKVAPGLVDVISTLGFQESKAAGTGMVLTAAGEVLTNNHVIENSTSVQVADIGNGRIYRASVVGYDRKHDVALLQLRGASRLPVVTLGDSASLTIGQRVVALGNAGGRGGQPSVVAGRVTGLNESIAASDSSAGTTEQLTGLIHHNAAIQPGDSGGPLVNTAGQVIGMNTAASSGFRFSSGNDRTQAFAIPINDALGIARQIQAGTSSATVHIGGTAFLGVSLLAAGDAAVDGIAPGSGAAIARVLPGTPAARAGIRGGDVIVSVDGHRISSPDTLQARLQRHHPGDRVQIGWLLSSGRSRSATVTLTGGPAG